jgi:hypothetical protein
MDNINEDYIWALNRKSDIEEDKNKLEAIKILISIEEELSDYQIMTLKRIAK